MRIDYYKNWLGNNNPANFSLAQNNSHRSSPVETSYNFKSHPNIKNIGKTVDETLLFHETYRPPNYLVLNDKKGLIGWGFDALFDCLCIKFCFKNENKPKIVKQGNSLDEAIANIQANLNEVDILILPYDDDYNFKDIITEVQKTQPDLPILIMCYSREKKIDTQRAERLRENGHFAFTGEEALDCQEYISELIEKALGKKGIDKLKINPTPINP